MRKVEKFTGKYSLSKTLRFKLIPVGNTLENFTVQKFLEKDKHRAESYKKVKKIIDRYHKYYIEQQLSNAKLDNLHEYAKQYFSTCATEKEKERKKEQMVVLEQDLRNQISKILSGHDNFKLLGKKEMITQILPEYLDENEEIALVNEFQKFSTYFSGFFTNRENMYTSEDKSTGIANRCINDNLPKFLDNIKTFEKIKNAIANDIVELETDFEGILNTKIEDMFTVDYFSFALSQNEIDLYNSVIGGYTKNDGVKVQGLNEYINLYNQKFDKEIKAHSKEKLPKLKILFKQILSDSTTLSFLLDKFENDNEVLSAIQNYTDDLESNFSLSDATNKLKKLFEEISSFDQNGIYVKNDVEFTTLSQKLCDNYNSLRSTWEDEYDLLHNTKNAEILTEKYIENRKNAFKKCESFSLAEIKFLIEKSIFEEDDKLSSETRIKPSLEKWIISTLDENIAAVTDTYNKAYDLMHNPYDESKKLSSDEISIILIKNLLDSIKNLERFMALFLGTGKEESKTDEFYGEFLPLYDRIRAVDKLYDKVRNYMTKKPYSQDKIKLNFENPTLANGWDINKEFSYNVMMFFKDDKYYLGILNPYSKLKPTDFEGSECDAKNAYKKMCLKQIPDAKKYFSSKQIYPQNPPEKIKAFFSKEFDKKSATKEQLVDTIRYIMEDFIPNYESLHDENGKCYFDYNIKEYNMYNSWNEFCDDLTSQSYCISFKNISEELINNMVDQNKLYLFQIYNKDFSQHSKGTPNMHTMYFKALFDECNLQNVIYKLNGFAQVFYREASINDNDKIVHPANSPIKNKNLLNDKQESLFEYDIIKDKRYTIDQFMLHLPITINFSKADKTNINNDVRYELKHCDKNYIIGIDRGERNLLYICVIDQNGNIVEQLPLNTIKNEYKQKTYSTDYNELLSKKEVERMDARKNWTSIENIKDLKSGYISQVVHKICLLVDKYDAIIAMEDLNTGFKNSRAKVEKSVYQKFEKMLIDKLNYYVDKQKSFDEVGGLYGAYQLTNKFESFKKMGKQNGFIFYVPAWLTSKIDPSTGFVDLLKPKYKSVSDAKSFIKKFDKISFNDTENYFEFEFDYSNFSGGSVDYAQKWTICTYGKRIETFRNPKTNNEWDTREIENLTDEFLKLFRDNNIDISQDIQSQIDKQDKAEFFKKLIHLLRLTLQMRNSKPKSEIDYLISPVKNASGDFYCSDDYKNCSGASALPQDADANGAYNIARKALWMIEQLKNCDDDKLMKANLTIKNAQWLEYAQRQK